MSQKRKDHKGRILKTGESQRKDLIYQYRYTDGKGVRRTIYDADLQELRRKAKHIQTAMDDGIDYEAGQITVMELLKRYVALKQGVRYNTKVGQIQAFLDSYDGDMVCSKLLHHEALGRFEEPKTWEIREINEIMNQSITGWTAYPNPRSYRKYGKQRGWMRGNKALDVPDGCHVLTAEECQQIGMPF